MSTADRPGEENNFPPKTLRRQRSIKTSFDLPQSSLLKIQFKLLALAVALPAQGIVANVIFSHQQKHVDWESCFAQDDIKAAR